MKLHSSLFLRFGCFDIPLLFAASFVGAIVRSRSAHDRIAEGASFASAAEWITQRDLGVSIAKAAGCWMMYAVPSQKYATPVAVGRRCGAAGPC